MLLLKKFLKNEAVRAALDGLKSCVIGIIFATGVYMILVNCIGSVRAPSADVTAVILTAALAAVWFAVKLIFKNRVSPVVLICIAGGAGILAYGWN